MSNFHAPKMLTHT